MEVLAQPPPPPAAAPAAPRRKLLLRLDDGSLIGDSTVLLNTPEGGAVLLEPQNAARVARAGQPELDRLERLLEEFRGRYPTAYKLPKSLVRNHNPYREEGQRALKRQKSLPNGDPLLGSPPGALPPGGAYAPAAGAGGGAYGGPLPYGSGGGGDDWARRCAGVLHAIYSDLGPKEFCYNLPAKDIFYRSVRETFPGIAAAYEAAVRHPITFRDIEQRLAGNQYDGPQAFADDLRLLFDNAVGFTVNPTDPVHRLAVRLRGRFEEAWAGTGLCHEARGRRSNAGVARERFEHSLYEAPPPPGRKSGSKQGRQDDFYRSASHEVSSYVEAAAPELPHDVMQDVATLIGDLPEEHMSAALDLLNPECKVPNEDGEMELDFEFITFESLMRVDTFIRSVNGLPPRPPPAPPQQHHQAPGGGAPGGRPGGGQRKRGGGGGGVQFDDSDDDEEYDEDDSDSE